MPRCKYSYYVMLYLQVRQSDFIYWRLEVRPDRGSSLPAAGIGKLPAKHQFFLTDECLAMR